LLTRGQYQQPLTQQVGQSFIAQVIHANWKGKMTLQIIYINKKMFAKEILETASSRKSL
jgi:hypothetical protein